MIIRLIFPYVLLALVILGYIYIRRRQLGPVLLKVNRILFSRYNTDSFLLIILIVLGSYFLSRLDPYDVNVADDVLVLGPYTYLFFYAALIMTVIGREVEKPALREKGISTPRGFWKWDEVSSYRWSKNTVTISMKRGRKKRLEVWEVNAKDKKEIDALLKKMTPKRHRGLKNKT